MKRLIWITIFYTILLSCENKRMYTFRVMESESSEPLSLVTLSVQDSSFYTNDSGFCSLNIEDELNITFSYLRYNSIDTLITNRDDDVIMIYLNKSIDFDTAIVPEINW